MSKIVINCKLGFKQDSYSTSPCVVEKVIGLSESEFSELKSHTLKDNCYGDMCDKIEIEWYS